MTPKDKELLLKDLCARLAYRVKFEYGNIEGSIDELCDIGYGGEGLKIPIFNHCYGINEIKPYLRPKSSMTKEERMEYFLLKHRDNDREDNIILIDEAFSLIDWLLSHHFYYRGLIEKNLAIEVTKENNPYKE